MKSKSLATKASILIIGICGPFFIRHCLSRLYNRKLLGSQQF